MTLLNILLTSFQFMNNKTNVRTKQTTLEDSLPFIVKNAKNPTEPFKFQRLKS